jgi:hypothetical protein
LRSSKPATMQTQRTRGKAVRPGLQDERTKPGEPERNALGCHKKRRAKLVRWMLEAEDCVAETRKRGSCAR